VEEKDLNQLYALNKEIKRQQEYLEELEIMATSPGSSKIRAGSSKRSGNDKTGDFAAKIADLEIAIRANMLKCWGEKCRLEKFISGVEDSEMRMILRLRHVDCHSWEDIAAELTTFDENGNVVKYPCRTTIMRRYRNFLKNKSKQNE
jgi:hypothetical protein